MATTEIVPCTTDKPSSSLEPPPSSIIPIRPYKVAEDIFLSPFTSSDTTELHRILNITNAISLGLYTASVTFPFPLENAEAFISHQLAKRSARGFADCWAIRRGEGLESPVIGLLSLHAFDHEKEGVPACYRVPPPLSGRSGSDGDNKLPLRCGVLGYWLSPEYTGQGIMTQAVYYGLRQIARSALGYEHVHGRAWEDNVASCRVMERAGMRQVPSVARFVPKFGEIKSSAQYVLDV
ncbi:hypothetical protein BG006_008787 [Podila minutissima]|uniref:N-acetyltransferase domain-containing protein n=1 Tax=Podila minutissima TaxID=64525 RepID=A0A9P5SFG9_9FUNG|nr:hypothetical protein BG006_008787 [Podila minutissima]